MAFSKSHSLLCSTMDWQKGKPISSCRLDCGLSTMHVKNSLQGEKMISSLFAFLFCSVCNKYWKLSRIIGVICPVVHLQRFPGIQLCRFSFLPSVLVFDVICTCQALALDHISCVAGACDEGGLVKFHTHLIITKNIPYSKLGIYKVITQSYKNYRYLHCNHEYQTSSYP